MKKRLVVLSAIALCLWTAVPAKSAGGADPGSRYADAFVFIEQGQAAEGKSDFATAYRSYQSALNTLHSIRTDSPDWNAPMVEYRLKDCQIRFDATKAKLPGAPGAEVSTAAVVTPSVQAPVVAPVPVITSPAPPPAPTVKTATADQSAKLKAQIDQLEAENHKLKSDLSETKHTAKSSSQFDELTKENKDLKAQLTAADKKAAAVKAVPAPVPVPVDSAETKKLRTDLANAHAEIDRLKKTAATPAPASSTVLASPPVAAPAADSAEMKKLRAELNKTQAEADAAKKTAAQVPDLQKQNKNLLAQLTDTQSKAASAKVVAPVPVPADNAELKKLRSDLANAQAEADKGRKASAQATDLEKQNKDLSARLAAADKKPPTPTVDAAELKKAQTDADKARKAAVDLEKQNEDLNTKLAAAEKKASIAPTDSAEVKSLQAQLADAHKQLDQANKSASQVSDLQKQNKDLNAKLTAAAAKPVPVDNSAELKKLHEELNAARAEADKSKAASARVNELEKKNKDLSAKLAAEKREVALTADAEYVH